MTAQTVPALSALILDEWSFTPDATLLSLDLSQVPFMDSSGLGFLIKCLKMTCKRTEGTLPHCRGEFQCTQRDSTGTDGQPLWIGDQGMIRVGLSTSVVQGGRSGVATYIFGILEGLRRTEAPVEITIIGLKNDRALFQPWLDWAKWLPVPERYRSAVRNVAWHQLVLPGVARREDFDLVHVPSYRRMVARLPCPQLATIHDCAAFAVAGKYDLARMIYGRVVVKWLARQVTRITTVSGATADDVIKYFQIPREQIDVIWNGIDHERFKPLDAGSVERTLMDTFSA